MVTRVHFQRLIERARLYPALPAAFVYPCDAESLQLALSAAFSGYLAPMLVGPERRIRDAAARASIDISSLTIVDTDDNPRSASVFAMQLASAGTVGALVKGSLGNDDLLAPIAIPESGLRSERRLSHAYFLELPGYPRALLVADAQMNVLPPLAAKKDIVLNTLGLAVALGIAEPKVALVTAMEVVNPAFPSTADAVALKTMGAQGMFGNAIVDGPLAMDSALSPEAARANGRTSPVAGNADVLIAPGMESGLMVMRTLMGMSGGLAAGLVLGASLPIVAPARNDTLEARMASCVLAALVAKGPATAKRHAPVIESVAPVEPLATP